MNSTFSLVSANPSTYFIEEKGWLSSSLLSVSREEFLIHQAKKEESNSLLSTMNGMIKTVALGILCATQSFRISTPNASIGLQLAMATLPAHALSLIPLASAQSSMDTMSRTNEIFQVANHSDTSTAIALKNGGGVISWHRYFGGFYVSKFDASWMRTGDEIQASSNLTVADTYFFETKCRLAPLSNNGFVATWISDGQDGSQAGIYGRLFDSVDTKGGGRISYQ